MRITRRYLLLAAVAAITILLVGMNQAAASNNAASAGQTGSKDTHQATPFNSPIGHHAVLTNPSSAGRPSNLSNGPENRPNVPPVFGPDIQIDPAADNPTQPHNETFMAANPANPLNFISGANDYGSGTYSGHYYTADGGATWSGGNFAGPYPGGSSIQPGGDPIGDFDAAGNAYFGDLGFNSGNNCIGGVYAHRSSDGGATYGSAVQVAASNSSHFLDKEWMAADKRTSGPHAGRLYMTWTNFQIGTGCNFNTYVNSPIYLAYSDNQGATWSTPAQIVEAARDQDQGSSIAIASDGTVYVAFNNCQGNPCTDESRIVKSTDGGVTWSTSVLLHINNLVGYIDTDGRQKYKGDATHPFRTNQFPVIAVSPFSTSTVYAVWNDHLSDGTYSFLGNTVYAGDIAFSRSTNGGTTWSTPMRVNDDSQGGTVHDQFFPGMTVGSDGTIHVGWFDRRDDANNILYREYYAQSTNGGTSFSANQAVADVGSNPAGVLFSGNEGFIGDYSGIGVNQNNSIVLPVWADERTASRQHVYTDRGVLIVNTPTPSPTPAPTSTPQPTVCPNPFVDINNNIFFHAINYLYCNGVVNGTDPTHYSPSGTATRGQFAKVVVLGFGTPFYTPSSGQTFTDVPPSYFAYVYIETGYHAGILSGFDPGGCASHGATYPCYLPNIPITRAQLTKLVVNAAQYPPFTPTGGGQTFSDVPNTNIFYVSIETAHNKGVINGYPDNTFRPNNNIRRDEMAQIVYKGITTP
ncbi:MAG: hypothetical protein DLM69_01525 [Candidatus Chloroheliales bacterium]|nr:MAG: hypothetical protein DLM69_01525 [Chloroflexota bacterium]